MKYKLLSLMIFFFLLVIGLSGCTTQISGKTPTNINTFASVKEGQLLRFYFLLEDSDGINTVSDGHVKIEIFDDENTCLYENEFDVFSADFVDYSYKLTGTNMGKAYEWRESSTDIRKGISFLGYGKASLTFITPNNVTLKAEYPLIEIPTYTEEELNDIAETDYLNSSTYVDKMISKGNFEVIVTRAGFFEKYEFGDKNRYFRIDMKVKNIGSAGEYFVPTGMAVIDNQLNQYDYTYGGTLDTLSTVHSGVTITGYVLFENVPVEINSVKLIFESGYDESFNPYLFEFDISLT